MNLAQESGLVATKHNDATGYSEVMNTFESIHPCQRPNESRSTRCQETNKI